LSGYYILCFIGGLGVLRDQVFNEKGDLLMGADSYDPMDIGDIQKPQNNLFPPPLRYGGNTALSGECLVFPPLRSGENKALEWMPCGHRSALHWPSI